MNPTTTRTGRLLRAAAALLALAALPSCIHHHGWGHGHHWLFPVPHLHHSHHHSGHGGHHDSDRHSGGGRRHSSHPRRARRHH